jgi:hypothetical protein
MNSVFGHKLWASTLVSAVLTTILGATAHRLRDVPLAVGGRAVNR